MGIENANARDLYWQWSMPVGYLRLSIPEQPLTEEEVAEIEWLLQMAAKQVRRRLLSSAANVATPGAAGRMSE